MPDIEKCNELLKSTFSKFIENKKNFEVCSEEDLPFGLKPHTRSICWLAEQVINQNLKRNKTEYKIRNIEEPDSDISAWDSKLVFESHEKPIFINIKVTDVTKPTRKNDIASVQKLLKFYSDNPGALLYYVVLKLKFNNRVIEFIGDPIIRYYPWLTQFVVNSRNHHIQAYYECIMQKRSTTEFIQKIKSLAKGRVPIE